MCLLLVYLMFHLTQMFLLLMLQDCQFLHVFDLWEVFVIMHVTCFMYELFVSHWTYSNKNSRCCLYDSQVIFLILKYCIQGNIRLHFIFVPFVLITGQNLEWAKLFSRISLFYNYVYANLKRGESVERWK